MKKAHCARVARRPVHGVLLLDKPIGLSSNDALQKVKWLLRAEKAGHTGTLDPLATGVLPICFGGATKFSQLQLDADKTYQATMKLGIKTTTGDAEGETISSRVVPVIDQDSLRIAELKFSGRLDQTPPMYSALKINGKPLYDYARAGITVDRESREIRLKNLSLDLMIDIDNMPLIKLQVTCSKGTYIRTLAEDIGEYFGCGSHLISLRRTNTGGLDISQCVTIEQLENLEEVVRRQQLLPIDFLLKKHEKIYLSKTEADLFLNGVRRKGQWNDSENIAVYVIGNTDEFFLLGTGHVLSGELIPNRLLNLLEIQQIQNIK